MHSQREHDATMRDSHPVNEHSWSRTDSQPSGVLVVRHNREPGAAPFLLEVRRLVQDGTATPAIRVYRASIVYLALLFAAIALDTLAWFVL